MATTKSTTPRRKPLQHPQERPAAPVVQFPLSIPTPRQTRPEEVNVMICECAADGVRLRLMPDPDAMFRIMNETYGPAGWECRYYYMNGITFCGTGVLNPLTGTYPRKDETAPAGKFRVKNPKRWETNGSFIASVARWGAGSDILRLPTIDLHAAQVTKEGNTPEQLAEGQVLVAPIMNPNHKPNDPPQIVGYRLASALTVDKKHGFLRADDGRIIGVQFLQGERKVVWQAE